MNLEYDRKENVALLKNKKRKVALFTQMITLLAFCCIFFLNTQEVNAQVGIGTDGLDFYVPYSEPTGNDVGYISLVLKNTSTGEKYLTTYYWVIEPYRAFEDNYDTGAFGLVNVQDNVITIEINNSSTDSLAIYSFGRYIDQTNKNQIISSELLTYNSWYSYSLDVSQYGLQVVGFQSGGNCVVGSFRTSAGLKNDVPTIHWGADDSLLYLQEFMRIISLDHGLLNTYLPKLNKIEAWESRNNEQLELLVSLGNDIATKLENIYTVTENMDDYIVRYMHYLELISRHLSTISVDVETLDNNVYYLKNRFDDLIEMIGESSASDKEVTDSFADDSSSQTDSLNNLNQQAQPNKPNIDNMSNKVDENLNVDIDANYGLLLSAFTGNNRILTMLLMVASVSLISYVLFGKR